jgi:CMP-N-acetylneuraminic acid synthetase
MMSKRPEAKDLRIVAVIPVRGSDKEIQGGMPELAGRPLIEYTIESALGAKLIDRVIVSTDSEEVRRLSRECGAEAPFIRPKELAREDTHLDQVLKHCIDWLETNESYIADIVVLLEITHPFREKGLITQVINTLTQKDLDSVFTAYEEYHSFWVQSENGDLKRIDDDAFLPRQRKRPVYREVSGMVCATRAEFVKKGMRLGKKVGLIPLRDIHALIDTHDESGLWLARIVMDADKKVSNVRIK